MVSPQEMKIENFPNAFVITVGFILIAGILTYIIPKGKFDRTIDPATNREIVVQGSYKTIEAENLSPFDIVLCIPKGIIAGAEVIALIFLVGGCFYIIEKTEALKQGVTYLALKMKGKEEITLILTALFFAMGGGLQGLQEEIIPLIPILIVLGKRLGYKPIVMIAISYGAAVIGATFIPLNPFGTVLAQKLASVPFLSGGIFRLITFIIGFSLWMLMVIRYANKNKIEKQVEPMSASVLISPQNKIILCLTLLASVVLVYGFLTWGWSLNEISAEFFILGVASGFIGKLGINETFKVYGEGMKEMTFAAMIIGLAHGIAIVLKEGVIIDSIIYGLFTPLQNLPTSLSAIGMMVSHSFFHIAVPSYSGHAVLTMPILVPLSDLIGLSREVCILAFQFGAILMDLLIPTNGALMAVIAIAGIPFNEWFAFAFKRTLAISLLGATIILVAGMLGF